MDKSCPVCPESKFNRILVENIKSTTVITFNIPENGNRLDLLACQEIMAAMEEANANPLIRSIILTGAGDVFCLGGKIDGFPVGYAMDQKEYSDGMVEMLKAIYKSRKPVIAAVNGNAFAGGFMMTECCDLAIAADNAEFCLTELVATGNYPMIALAVNGKSVPKKRLFEIILTGKPVTARLAESWNLINCVVPAEQVLNKALEYGDVIASRSDVAVMIGRQTYYEMAELTPSAALAYSKPALLSLLAMDDVKEGALAVKEGRAPNYIGK